MRERKYLLESRESPLYFWYSTSSQNLDGKVPDLCFLTDTRSQG
jgi:hypothetical protein